jgi:tetratricopeptide (TPR) repeat protein/L-ascorbate metabolism protein UlaG (beta-lactamase superfamily)
MLEKILHKWPSNSIALLLKARMLNIEGKRFAEALDAVESLLSQKIADDAVGHLIIGMGLFQKSIAQTDAGKSEEAIVTYDELLRFLGEVEDSVQRELVAVSLSNKGIVQAQAGKFDEAIVSYDEVLRRFGKAEEPALRKMVAVSLNNKGIAQEQLGKLDEAIVSYDEVLRRFDEAEEPELREMVAMALVNKGFVQHDADKFNEAIASYDEVLRRFDEAKEPELREMVAMALVNKAFVQHNAGKLDEATVIYDEVLRRFSGTGESNENMARILAIAFSRRTELQSEESTEKTEEAKQQAVTATRSDLSSNLSVYLKSVLRQIKKDKQQDYFKRMDEAKERTDRFLLDKSFFNKQMSFLLILRQWNSYTPAIPAEEEADRGGGYFLQHGGEGIVIDPGYDFIDNFYRAGGRLSDIDHIVVTHAHDDHTAELEALLMLLHQHSSRQIDNPKRVSLYLSTGVQRKFAGLLNLRDTKFKRLMTLVWGGSNSEQRIPLNETTTLYVLPAYHDDVITRDMSVGLGFVLQTAEGESRQIAFTGDSGLFPRKCNSAGEPLYYDKEKERPQLDTVTDKALYEQYPAQFKNPHLLVAHIGSIKKQEFEPPELLREGKEQGCWYYPNHLGLLGTLTMLHQIKPKAAIVSEFGSELRGFHVELVSHITQALHDRQEADERRGDKSYVIPGDLTIAYDITSCQFLCHDTCNFMEPKWLVCRLSRDYKPEYDRPANWIKTKVSNDEKRVYLFSKKRRGKGLTEEARDCQASEEYYHKFFNYQLPYHDLRKK